MSDKITSEKLVGTQTVNGRTLDVFCSTWRDAAGLSYDVYDAATGACLTEAESFDDYPTTDQMTALTEEV